MNTLILTIILFFTQELRWTESVLTKENFKTVTPKESNELAKIYTGIGININYNQTGKGRAYAYMDEQKSELRADLLYNNTNKLNETLIHEKGHFDLTEWIVRCLNRELKNITEISIIYKLLYKYNDQLNYWQKIYDTETDHSNNKENQKIWNEKIRKLLLNF
jgi:hypothetical protein